ncbi:MAG: hypothetical protein ACI8S6_003875 [Myxococcota bacterium]|jgi:hypothetical protein
MLLSLLLIACTESPAPIDSPGWVLSGVTWQQGWDTAGLTRSGDAWSTVTDLGYTVEITRGYLTTYSLGLEPCPEALRPPVPGWGLLSTARAAHGPTINAATLPHSRAVDLLALSDTTLASLTFPQSRFCEVTTLVARADKRTEGIPEGVALEGASLMLTGHWQRGSEREDFDVKSTLANSSRLTLEDTAHIGTGEVATISIRHRAKSLFDGIELATESDARILRGVLTNLIAHTTTTATLTPLENR